MSDLQFETLLAHFINIEKGIKFIMIVLAAFFVWKVVKILYSLIAGVFLGGL